MKLRRRQLLSAAGAAGLTLPFLGNLIGRAAADTHGAIPKRVVFCQFPYGTVRDHWFPSMEARGTGTRLSARCTAHAFADMPGDPSPVFDRATWDGLFDRMVMLDGVDGAYASGHERCMPLTGFAYDDPMLLPAPSIDNILVDRAALYSSEPLLRALHVGGNFARSANLSMSWTHDGISPTPNPPSTDPVATWDAIFESVASTPEATAALDRRRGIRAGVTDFVAQRYRTLASDPRLGAEDRRRIEAYLAYLGDYERSLGARAAATCAPPPRPDAASYPRGDRANEPRLFDQVQNVVHALRCDVTRVVTFNLAPTALTYRSLPEIEGDHHGLSHGKDSSDPDRSAACVRQLLAIDRLHTRAIAELARGLDAAEDPATGRSMLDDTVILVTSDMGSVNNHKGMRMPVLLIGGSGFLRGGHVYDFRSPYARDFADTGRSERIGISYNNVLITLCQLFGLTPEQYEHGQAGIGDYRAVSYYARPFPGEYEEYEAYAFGDKRTPITEILI